MQRPAPTALPSLPARCALLLIMTLMPCSFARTLPTPSIPRRGTGPCNAFLNAMKIWVAPTMHGCAALPLPLLPLPMALALPSSLKGHPANGALFPTAPLWWRLPRILRELEQSTLAILLAFADDVMLVAAPAMLVAAPAQALGALALWERLLKPCGLQITPHKLGVWDRLQHAPFREALARQHLAATVSAHGVTLCGLPLESSPAPDTDDNLAWGTPTHIDLFLQRTMAAYEVRLRALGQFVSLLRPGSVALHASLHVLRTNLLPRFVHLFRLLSVDRCLQLTREIDSCTLPWLCEHLDLPLPHPAVRPILQTPTAHGGLSLLRLHLEALLHCITGILALPVEGVPLMPVETDSLTSATALLQRLARINAPTATAHLLPHRRAAHLRRLARQPTCCRCPLPPPTVSGVYSLPVCHHDIRHCLHASARPTRGTYPCLRLWPPSATP